MNRIQKKSFDESPKRRPKLPKGLFLSKLQSALLRAWRVVEGHANAVLDACVFALKGVCKESMIPKHTVVCEVCVRKLMLPKFTKNFDKRSLPF